VLPPNDGPLTAPVRSQERLRATTYPWEYCFALPCNFEARKDWTVSPLPRPREAFSLRYALRYCDFIMFDRAVIARQMTQSLPRVTGREVTCG